MKTPGKIGNGTRARRFSINSDVSGMRDYLETLKPEI
jgi:hypothetical protein